MTVKVGYYDQLGRALDGRQRVREAIAGDKGEPSLADVNLMRRFWFDGDAQFAPIATLSGGERRRLQLLLTLVEQPNVLLLDEPTNDLDLDTLRALEDMLDDWPGIAVVVSHDRAFLDRTIDQLLALDGRGGVREVRGGVAAWLAERAAQVVPAQMNARTPTAPVIATSSAGARSAGQPATGSVGSTPPPLNRAAIGASPSTIRRRLGEAERKLELAGHARDAVAVALSLASDHIDRARLASELSSAQVHMDTAEERWLDLAAAAEALGLDV